MVVFVLSICISVQKILPRVFQLGLVGHKMEERKHGGRM